MGKEKAVQFVTSTTLASVDKAARNARGDIAAAQPIQLLINAMATGEHNGKKIPFSEIKEIAKYLGDKLVPSLKAVDVNNRVTPADPAEWIDYLLKDTGITIEGQGVPPQGNHEKPEQGGGGETRPPPVMLGGISPIPDTQNSKACIQSEKEKKIPVNPGRISSHKRPQSLHFINEEKL